MQQEEWELDLGRDFPAARVSELRYLPAPYSREISSEMGLVRTLAISGDCWKVEWGRGWGVRNLKPSRLQQGESLLRVSDNN